MQPPWPTTGPGYESPLQGRSGGGSRDRRAAYLLGQHKDGLSRTEIAGQIGDDVLATIGVKRDELAAKLRQPLGELVGDKKLHTVGEKRLMKYHAGEKK